MFLSIDDHLLKCSFKEHLGIECLGCGTQRSFLALMKGDVVQSFIYNPGVLLILLTLLISFLVCKYFPKYSFKTIITSFSVTVLAMTVSYILKLVGV
ncbi:MAG: hypothetical protein COA32_06235 [Fluviicola sp.]|nr:MAG: hypothetical protein COA32_06235 [Fluviicola sp.]